jgi:hypothetical protein
MLIKTIKNESLNTFDLKDLQLVNPGLSFKKFDTSPQPQYGNGENAEEEDESLKLNDKGLIGKTTGGFSNLIKIPEEKDDDENDTIKRFSKYETGDDGRDIIDFNASASVTADAKGLNINKVGGIIDQTEFKSKIFFFII